MSALAAWEFVPAHDAPAPARRRHLHVVPAPAGSTRVAGPARPAGLRLTRAGRFTLLVLVVALAVLSGLVLTARAAAAQGPERSVTVRAGQTLSEVAAAELPQLPIAEGVAQLQLVNHLPSVQVRAGQQLLVPHVG